MDIFVRVLSWVAPSSGWEVEDGFAEADIGVVRDNARQLKFKPESTDFE
jgi:hypothetical protein